MAFMAVIVNDTVMKATINVGPAISINISTNKRESYVENTTHQ